MPLNFDFDFKNPDYIFVFNHRIDKLRQIRNNPSSIPHLWKYYREYPAQFITDWGTTYDPRNLDRGLPATIPFLLYPKQEEWVNWILKNWRERLPGVTEKSREMGVSWLAMALSCTLALLYDGFSAGFVSRVEVNLDKRGDPDSLFEKGRSFLRGLPPEFRGGWDETKHTTYLKISFPYTAATITGGAGPDAFRGARKSLILVDESAHLPNSKSIDKALSAVSNCRQDISTPNGRANSFAMRRFSGRIPVFTMHWRDDPRKDEIWYKKQCDVLIDPVIIAQELDIDYSASVEGIVIPTAWVQSAIDAHLKLKIAITGEKKLALDLADKGLDINVAGGRHGILLNFIEGRSGRNSDLFATTQWAVDLCDEIGIDEFIYDGDGLGAAIHGDLRAINERREEQRRIEIAGFPFRANGAIINPESQEIPRVKNIDRFYNFKAQSWWYLRTLFLNTHRAVAEGKPFDPDEIISLDSTLAEITNLAVELSQPTFFKDTAGKMLVNKTPDGEKSPNYADTLMMLYSPMRTRGFFSV